MSQIDVLTTQNVNIQFEAASIGDRVVAYILDLLILGGYLFVMLMIYYFLENYYLFHYAVSVIIYLPIFLYDLVCEYFFDGQSIGKKIKKIKVIKIDGTQPTFINYFLRWIIRPVEITLSYGIIAMITIAVNGKGQRIGDIAARTTVVRVKQQTKLEDTILVETYSDYNIVFAEAGDLNDKEIGLIKEVLNLKRNEYSDIAYFEILKKTKDSVCRKININTDISPRIFLETILKDYNYIHTKNE